MVEAAHAHSPGRAVTDLDILAFRFPHASNAPVRPPRRGSVRASPLIDPALQAPGSAGDMLIGEVKEGSAMLNRGAADSEVMRAALVRFGCSDAESSGLVVQALLRDGQTETSMGHRVRLVAFGSTAAPELPRQVLFISMAQMLGFLEDYIDTNWELLRHAQYKDPAFGFLLLQAKARHGEGFR